MFEKRIVVDAKGHIMGRLASVVAKELLSGQNVVLVRAEGALIGGGFMRNRVVFMEYLNKRTCTNPRKGHYHYRSPAKMLWKCVRGMLPHRTERGKAALQRLKVFEGVPSPYDQLKRVVVPAALSALHTRPGRRTTSLSKLASSVGWKYKDVVAKLEEKRNVRAQAYLKRRKTLEQLKAKAVQSVEKQLSNELKTLADSGY